MKLVYIALAMGVTDLIGTSLVIAESKGDALRAGILDALGDISGLVYLALGVTAISQWNAHSILTLLVVCVTSFVTTAITVRIESHAKLRKTDALPIDLSSATDVT